MSEAQLTEKIERVDDRIDALQIKVLTALLGALVSAGLYLTYMVREFDALVAVVDSLKVEVRGIEEEIAEPEDSGGWPWHRGD